MMTLEILSTGQKIKDYREAAGMTQAELASLSGINRITIHKYESGSCSPGTKNLQKIALALRVSPGSLIGQSEEGEIMLAVPEVRQACEIMYMMSKQQRALVLKIINVIAEENACQERKSST